MKFLLILFLLCATVFAQETITLTGSVRDAQTREGIPSANIRVLGTSLGTVANADGNFRLILRPGKQTVVISSIGYSPDTLRLFPTADIVRHVTLQPSDIILPEIVVSSEDPAIEIIRRAIANKQKWAERLKSFEMEAFTRQVLKREGDIASITESFTKGYWQQGDTLREIVKQKRQTENIKSEFNFASVGRIINFNDDEIRFVGYTFVGPTAVDALDYYDYKLLRTRANFGKEIYEIRMTPRTRTVPLFEGTITIANESYALMGVDVQPNEAFSIPFLKAKTLRYRQQFNLYDHSFWMPADIRIDAGAEIGFFMIQIPRIDFSQTSVITNYQINSPIPDSIFQKPRLSVDSVVAATLDTTYWQENDVLPLTADELQAYKTLDSTQTLDVQFRPRGITFQLGAGSEKAGPVIEYLDLSFNRVEGFHLGAKSELDSLIGILDVRAGFAYGFSDKRTKYNVGATLFTSSSRRIGFGGDVYRVLDHRPDAGFYGTLFNSFTSLLNRNDYMDYFEAEGGRMFLQFTPSAGFAAQLSFTAEEHRSVVQHSEFSIFARSRYYRPNPPAGNGKLRSVRIDMRIGNKPAPLDFVRNNGVEIAAEYSSPTLANSGFDFARVYARGTVVIPTFGRSLLLTPQLAIQVASGTSSGTLPAQRLFDLESSSSWYAPFGVFRAMNVKEFSGTRFVAIHLEHNFRSLPFLALGIPFLYENNIEFLLHGGGGQTWGTGSIPAPYSFATTGGWYGELGFGFNRIFEILRADFTWRLSAPGNFRFTVGVANLF